MKQSAPRKGCVQEGVVYILPLLFCLQFNLETHALKHKLLFSTKIYHGHEDVFPCWS